MICTNSPQKESSVSLKDERSPETTQRRRDRGITIVKETHSLLFTPLWYPDSSDVIYLGEWAYVTRNEQRRWSKLRISICLVFATISDSAKFIKTTWLKTDSSYVYCCEPVSLTSVETERRTIWTLGLEHLRNKKNFFQKSNTQPQPPKKQRERREKKGSVMRGTKKQQPP